MRVKKISGVLLPAFFCLTLNSSTLSFAGEAGTAAASFLKMGAGARAAALADTQAALVDDAFASYWNPAGLASVRAPELGIAHNRWFADAAQQYAVWAAPVRSAGTLALSYNRLGMDDFQGFDAQGTPTQELKSQSSAAALGWGKTVMGSPADVNGLAAGVNLQLIQDKQAGVSASSFGVDLGFIYRPSAALAEALGPWSRRTSLGFAARHLGRGLKYDKDTAPLPVELTAGLGYSHFWGGDVFTLGTDFHSPSDADAYVSAGAEYWFRDFFALRGGFRAGQDQGSGARLGAGLRVRKIQIDYAWAGWGDDLGETQRVSLLWRFGRRLDPSRPGISGDLFKYYMEEGKRHRDLGLYEQAVMDFNRALEIRAGDPEAAGLLLEAGKLMRENP